MYLIITAIAAAITTAFWYKTRKNSKYRLGTLCLMYWGASLMWLVDCIALVISGEEEVIDTSLDAILLGICAVALGLAIWLIILLLNLRKHKTQATSITQKTVTK